MRKRRLSNQIPFGLITNLQELARMNLHLLSKLVEHNVERETIERKYQDAIRTVLWHRN
jgi:hypothetical protein